MYVHNTICVSGTSFKVMISKVPSHKMEVWYVHVYPELMCW